MFDINKVKVVYRYDKDGVLSGTSILDESNKDTATGKWVYPPNTTPVAPPPNRKGYCLVWKFGVWSYRSYEPKIVLSEKAQLEKEYKDAQANCTKSISLAFLRGDDEAVRGIREDFAEIQQAYNDMQNEMKNEAAVDTANEGE
jgi:hypothetical protein|nr:MAG TPA: hypothetical protein [Caudoviricetes sp.]